LRKHYLRSLFTLGTSLTALFLLVRCSVPGRDYSPLGIGDNAGSGGLGGDDVLLGSSGHGGSGGTAGAAGQDGLGDAGGLGGSGGAPPPPPIPCIVVINDAGSEDAGSTDAGTDAGSSDAGSADAGTPYEPCACVDGFIQAVDADGDGDGTRACTVAPGLDCDDDNASVTHNSCGGCTVLPNTPGEDCLDCGAYICEGPESVVCATKPAAVVVDPDCRCLDALIVARDTDQDGEGTRLCEQNPGNDCNDGLDTFVTDECGGCNESLPGSVGYACNECGTYTCSGTSLVCTPSTSTRCENGTTVRQKCVGTGFWDYVETCANACYQGNCETCTPGTFQCVTVAPSSTMLYRCNINSSYGILWSSWASCYDGPCNETTGTCTTGYLMLPRDQTFDVVPLLRPGLPWHDVLNTASDSDYG